MDGDIPIRLVLEGVPRVGFHPKQSSSAPQDHAFPACLTAILEYLHDDLRDEWLAATCEDWHGVHDYLMGTSGMAFHLLWSARAWDSGPNWLVTSLASDPLEPIREAIASVGYDSRILLRGAFAQRLGLPDGGCDDRGTYLDHLVQSLGRGRPVIAFGTLRPPQVSLVTGYDEQGEVLIGWDFFQDDALASGEIELEPSGYLRRREWFEHLDGLVVVGDKQARPPRDEAYRGALRRGLRVMRTREVHGLPAAAAAYDAWAGDLDDPDDWDSTAVSGRLGASCDAGGHIAEARCWGAGLLRQAAEALPDAAAALRAAESCFLVIHDLVWRLWQTPGGGTPEEQQARFARAETRRELSRIVGLFQEQDVLAADHLERALAAVGVPLGELPPATDAERELVARHEARRRRSPADRSHFRDAGWDGVWVDVVPEPSGGSGLAAALEAALAVTQHPVPLADLGPLVDPPGEWATALAAISRATGWRLRVEELPADPNHIDRQRLITDMVLSINQGLPVVAGYGAGYGVVYGYHIWSIELFYRGGEGEVRLAAADAGWRSPVVFLDGYDG